MGVTASDATRRLRSTWRVDRAHPFPYGTGQLHRWLAAEPVPAVKIVLCNQQEVATLLPMPTCVELMEEVMAALSAGECHLPLRRIHWMPEVNGALALMPSHWPNKGAIGLKAVTFFPGNEGTERDTHQGAVLLYDGRNGSLLAVMDGTAITAIRTAGASGAATRHLARSDAKVLALLGSGVLARTHLEAMLAVRPLTQVRVYSLTAERAARFADAQKAKHPGLDVVPAASVKEAVDGADIVCTVTSSKEPVLRGEWLTPGTHVNAVGASVATARELDAEAVRRSRVFVDRMESAQAEAGDFLLARAEGAVGDDHLLGEIGDVITGRIEGRVTAGDITLYESVGVAAQDLAAARHVCEQAHATGLGTGVEFGGEREAEY